MLQKRNGKILIDGVDLDYVHPEKVRTCINGVSQHLASIPGTVRDNLDPHSVHPDHIINAALSRYKLGHLLDKELSLSKAFDPLMLSAGERQLFAIAAAALKTSKVVFLDEVTSQ